MAAPQQMTSHVANHQQQVGMTQGIHPQQSQQISNATPQPSGNPQASQQAVQAQKDEDPISKFKSLLPRLRDSLVNLFKYGGHLLYQHAQQDENGVQTDNFAGRFDKCLEEFYALCDQIEIHLRLAQELVQQDRDSSRNTPIPIAPGKTEVQHSDGLHYSQYLTTARIQVNCAKDIRDVLRDCLKTFTDLSHP